MEKRDFIKEYLLGMSRLNPQKIKDGWTHPHSWLLEHGVFMGPAKEVDMSGTMENKMCFNNCFEMILAGYTYCEGYAYGQFIPMHHAWLLDRHGNVIDPTWEHSDDTAYFGVAVERRALAGEAALNNMYPGLLFPSGFAANVFTRGLSSQEIADLMLDKEAMACHEESIPSG